VNNIKDSRMPRRS